MLNTRLTRRKEEHVPAEKKEGVAQGKVLVISGIKYLVHCRAPFLPWKRSSHRKEVVARQEAKCHEGTACGGYGLQIGLSCKLVLGVVM